MGISKARYVIQDVFKNMTLRIPYLLALLDTQKTCNYFLIHRWWNPGFCCQTTWYSRPILESKTCF